MNVLFIGNYYNDEQCRNLLKSLATSKQLDVACRPLIPYSGIVRDDSFTKMEDKNFKPHYIIQYTKDKNLVNQVGFENIAYIDTSYADAKYINLMDYIMVPSSHNRDELKKAGVTIPMYVVPYAFDESICFQSYRKIDTKKDFTFYSYVENEIQARILLENFHAEFKSHEPVNLGICTDTDYLDDIKAVEKALGIQGNGKGFVVKDSRNMRSLHASCDVYISASTNGDWCSNTVEAMGFGKTPIVNKYGAHLDYLDSTTCWIIDCILGTAKGEKYSLPDSTSLRTAMRTAYTDKKTRSKKSELGVKRALENSFGKIGNLTKRVLYECKEK